MFSQDASKNKHNEYTFFHKSFMLWETEDLELLKGIHNICYLTLCHL